jgi:hypothetical protein
LATIRNARSEIENLRQDTPNLTRNVIEEMWDTCFRAAINEAEGEMDRSAPTMRLSWEDVFDTEYNLDA